MFTTSGAAYDPRMFRHIVLLTFTDDTGDEAVQQVVDQLRTLPSRIPAIRSYTVGRDAGLADGNAHLSAVADFDDVAGYLEYRDHQAHQDVIATYIRPVLAGRSAIQYEF